MEDVVSKMLEKHKPGTYMAKPVDWSITKTKAGLPQVVVCFRYDAGDILWFGSFKDTVVERTVDTLIAMGLKGTLETLADGVPGSALDVTREMEIVIEHRPDLNGNLRAGVAWVNDPTKSRMKEGVSKAEAGMLLSGMNAVLMQRKQAAAGQAPVTRTAPNPLNGPVPNLQVPFSPDVPF